MPGNPIFSNVLFASNSTEKTPLPVQPFGEPRSRIVGNVRAESDVTKPIDEHAALAYLLIHCAMPMDLGVVGSKPCWA